MVDTLELVRTIFATIIALAYLACVFCVLYKLLFK